MFQVCFSLAIANLLNRLHLFKQRHPHLFFYFSDFEIQEVYLNFEVKERSLLSYFYRILTFFSSPNVMKNHRLWNFNLSSNCVDCSFSKCWLNVSPITLRNVLKNHYAPASSR